MKKTMFLIFLGMIHVFAVEPLVTDRPDQTESSSTVPKSNLQIETGLFYETDQYTHNRSNVKNTNLNIATTLFRYGLTKNIELRLGAEHSTQKLFLDDNEILSTSGLNGVDVGAKIFLRKEDGYIPESAVILSAGLPIGNEDLVAASAEYTMLFAMAHSLSPSVGFGYNAGFTFDENEEINWIYSAAVGIGLLDNTGAFIELYGGKHPNVDAQFLFDMGFTHLLSKTFQLDLSGGAALSQESPDWFISTGFSYRFEL